MQNAPVYTKITHVYLSGNKANTLTIPIKIARSKGLEGPTNVIVEETDEGFLVKKLLIQESFKK